MSEEAGDKAGKAEEGAGRDRQGPPVPAVEGLPLVPGPPVLAVPPDGTGEEASEDMPTLPPASRGSVVGLRWATSPLQRRSGHVAPEQPGTEQVAPEHLRPDQMAVERFETGPSTVVMPTVAVPTVPIEPERQPEGVAAGDEKTIETRAVQGATWLGGRGEVAGPKSRGGEARPRRRRRGALILVAIALVVAVAGAVAGALVLGGGSPHRAAVPTVTPEATFEGFLAESARAHQLLAAAVSGACQPAPPATTARQGLIVEVGRAVGMRRSVLDAIASDRRRLLAMNGGPSLVNALDEATRASLSADQGYEAWLQDLQATGCYGAPTNDIHYRAATRASLAASLAKERVVATWAGVASRYGLPSWTAGQL